MIKDGQIRELFRLLATGRRLAFVARKTGMDEKTARKYRQANQLPSERVVPRQWRTRADPFEEVWPAVEKQLEQDHALRPITLFRWLQEQHGGKFPDSQRRTFERRVRTWRATQGPNQTVMFAQVHHAGDLAASDFTHMDALEVTIGGQPFPHLVYHFALTYSNWESVTVCTSESFEALSEGLQNALWELGGVPRRHRSDSLSAAVNNLSDRREFRQRYQDLLDHYGLEGQRINVREPHENGDAESSHGHFKTAVDQALRLRGSRDFTSREEYMRFLDDLVAARNRNRQKRFAEELAVLRPLPAQRVESCRRLYDISVGVGSTIQVLRNTYSVPSRLIGHQVDVVVGVEQVEVWHAGVLIQQMPRLSGACKHAINYRHIIDSLVRKPGAFANYVYREELFPTSHFRMAYDALCGKHPEKEAAKQYLRILQLAAKESEAAVQDALRAAFARGEEISFAAIEAAVQNSQQVPAVTEVQVEAPDLRVFDSLLGHWYMEVGSHEYSVRQDVPEDVPADQAIIPLGFAKDVPATEHSRAEGTGQPGVDAHVERGVEGTVSGASPAHVPRALPESGGPGGQGVVEPSAVLGGADTAGMPDTSGTSDPAAVGAITLTSRQDLGELRLDAHSPAYRPSGGEPKRGFVLGSEGEPPGLRQAGLGEDSLRLCPGGAAGPSGPTDAVHHVQPAGTDPLGCEAGLAAAKGHQATVTVRRSDHRRPWLCSAEPRGDGSSVHAARGTLRAGERPPDQQPTVFTMGADFQGCHDDSRRHRPVGAPLRHLGVERPQLPCGDSPAEAPILVIDNTWQSGGIIATCTREF